MRVWFPFTVLEITRLSADNSRRKQLNNILRGVLSVENRVFSTCAGTQDKVKLQFWTKFCSITLGITIWHLEVQTVVFLYSNIMRCASKMQYILLSNWVQIWTCWPTLRWSGLENRYRHWVKEACDRKIQWLEVKIECQVLAENSTLTTLRSKIR